MIVKEIDIVTRLMSIIPLLIYDEECPIANYGECVFECVLQCADILPTGFDSSFIKKDGFLSNSIDLSISISIFFRPSHPIRNNEFVMQCSTLLRERERERERERVE